MNLYVVFSSPFFFAHKEINEGVQRSECQHSLSLRLNAFGMPRSRLDAAKVVAAAP
jgi:hypothetical protein